MTALLFAVFLTACLAAGATGGLFPTGAWYRSLAKPTWTPPNWAFPVAWISIYVLIAYAGARVAVLDGSGLALAFFALQFSLNTLWTPVFFGLRRMGLAFFIIVALWGSVVATAVTFWQLDWVAGLLLVPYVAWASVATALNFTVWRLNPNTKPLKPSEL